MREDEATMTCSFCGKQSADGVELLTWTTSVERGQTLRYCTSCSRENLRALEGKLDNEWW